MSHVVDYYFSLVSPWSYLGHDRFMALTRQHGVEVQYVPVFLGPVFAETGGLPLPKRAPHRQRYRFLELQRWREKLGVPLNLRRQPGYDHSYYFIASFMEDHLRWHARRLG